MKTTNEKFCDIAKTRIVEIERLLEELETKRLKENTNRYKDVIQITFENLQLNKALYNNLCTKFH